MRQMWSPWRSQHISQLNETRTDEDSESVFSRYAKQDRDEENLILWRGEEVFVIMNRYPYNNGHLLILPYRVVEDYTDLTSEEQIEIATTIDRCIQWLKQALQPEGFNIGMNIGKPAGAGLPGHLHVHIVPRWSGDTSFMATTADLRVVPEAMEETYRRLREACRPINQVP